MAKPVWPMHVTPVPAITNVQIELMPHRIGNEPVPTLYVRGCRGERVNVAFYITDGFPAEQVMIRSALPKITDLRWIKSWWQAGRNNFEADRQVWVAELLLHDGDLVKADPRHPELGNKYPEIPDDSRWLLPLDCDDHAFMSGFEQGVMLTITLPEESCVFNLTITATDKKSLTVPVEVTVYPFDLPKCAIDHSMYYRSQLQMSGEPGIDPERRTPQQMIADLKTMVAHGITNPCTSVGMERLDDVLQLRAKAGCSTDRYFTGACIGPAALPHRVLDWPQLKADTLKYAETVIKEAKGARQVYAYCKDEAQAEGIRKQAPLWRAAREAGLKIYGFVGALSEDAMMKNLDDLQDVVIRAGTYPTQALGDALHKSGRLLYVCAGPGGGNEDPDGNRRAQGLKMFNRPWIDGTMEYCLMHVWTGTEHPWDDFSTQAGDHYRSHMMTYPTLSGVCETLQLEGYAAGVIDYRYLQLLAGHKTKATKEFFDRIKREEATIDLQSMREECARLLMK